MRPLEPVLLVPNGNGEVILPPLPRSLTTFVGRRREVDQVCALLREPTIRLLTLLGPGGVGKSRLAVRVAEVLADDFPAGVAFVPLGVVTAPDAVGPTIARALGVRELGDRPLGNVLHHMFGNQRSLLVLDSFEHVLPAATLVSDALQTCPGLKALITSRAPLRLSGEHGHAVPSLDVPDPDAPPEQIGEAEAVRLFAARARAAAPGFTLTLENAPVVAEICRRIDGLPLAVELAAARVRLLPPDALLARLERTLPLLTGGPREAPARLRTMRDAIAWSYDLLAPAEQRLFRRLAVFVRGFTLDAAANVAGDLDASSDILMGIESLVDQSLVHRQADVGGEPHFGMLDTVREYACEALVAAGEETLVRGRHRDYFQPRVENAVADLRGPERDQRLSWFGAAHDEVIGGLMWGVQGGDATATLRLAVAAHSFWYELGHLSLGRRWLRTALANAAESPAELCGWALFADGSLARRQGDTEAARARLEASVDLARAIGSDSLLAHALMGLGVLQLFDGAGTAVACRLQQEAAAVFQRAGDKSGQAWALYNLGDALGLRETGERADPSDREAAAATYAESLAQFRALGDRWGEVAVTLSLGHLALQNGDAAKARRLLHEGLAKAQATGNLWRVARARDHLGQALAALGRQAEANAHFAESVTLYRRLGNDKQAATVLHRLGLNARAADDPQGAFDAWRESIALGWACLAGVHMGTVLNDLADLADGMGRRHTAARLHSLAATARAAGHEPLAAALRPAFDQMINDLEVARERPAKHHTSEVGASPLVEGLSARSVETLTRRERDVLRLLADGRTDREIAETLCVSRRTAATHVAHIFTKLGVSSRAGAAALAVRLGLV